MRPAAVSRYLAEAIKHRDPVLLVGSPGVGKSDLVEQATKVAGAHLLLRHPVTDSPIDYKGLGMAVDGRAEFLPFGDLRALLMATVPTVCFLDDLGQAVAAVQAAAMQLLLARSINGQKVSDLVTFMAATNRKGDRAGVSGILEPVKSRFVSIIEVEPDVDDWVQWALEHHVHPMMIAFIKYRPKLLNDFQASAEMVNSPCPRTVVNAAKVLKYNLPRLEMLEGIKGAAGQGFMTEFMGFQKLLTSGELPDVDLALQNPLAVRIPTDVAINFAFATLLATKATRENMRNLVMLASRMEPEYGTFAVKGAVKHNPSVTETAAFIQWAAEHQEVFG